MQPAFTFLRCRYSRANDDSEKAHYKDALLVEANVVKLLRECAVV